MKKLLQLIVLPLFISILIGCTSPTPTPQSTSSPAPALIIEPTATSAPIPTPELVESPTPTTSNFTTGQHPFTSEKAGRSYLLFLPAEYGKDPQKQWPLILFLHGSGTRGTKIEYLKLEALPQILEFTPDFPAIVLSPQLNDTNAESYWTREKVEESVFTLLDEIQSTYMVDPKRVYLTGVSLGANGTWEYGLRHPGRFAALVPVMGFIGDTSGFRVPDNLCDLKNVPIWAFHGALDSIVPISAEQGLVDALKTCGGNVQFTIYPDGDHDISGRAYTESELFPWLSSQSLK
ncbi:MAG: dienelactone hydrolase family protein [Anaerolineales bacterium]|nr:dienelactone hydrolase family protein [Anaerolineales bacterium]